MGIQPSSSHSSPAWEPKGLIPMSGYVSGYGGGGASPL